MSAPSSRLWSLLAGSLLRPAPALAYLVLLLLSFPVYRLLMPTPPPGTIETGRAAIPSAQSGPGEPSGGARRGASNGNRTVSKAGAPLELEGTGALPEPRGAASPAGSSIASLVPRLKSLRVLRLTGDLALRSGTTQSAPVRIQVARTDALVLKLFPDVEGLPKDRTAALLVRVLDGGSVVAEAPIRVSDLEEDQSLSMLLDRERLRAGTTYRVEVTTSPAATAGAPIFRQSFRLDEP